MKTLSALLRSAGDALPYAILGIYSLLCVIALVDGAALYFQFAAWVIAFASPAIGAGLIWSITHSINHLDDRGKSKGPPDWP